MISKPKVTAVIVFSVLAGLVFSPVFAERYRSTEGIEEVEVIEVPADESLVDSTYNRAAGTVYITGKTITEKTNSAGEALVGTAKAGGETLGDAADAVTGTAGAAYRTVVGGEEPVEEVAIEQPKEKGLFEASWDAIAGTAGAIGRTFEAAYASVFPVKEGEDEPEPDEPEEPEARTYRFAPRHHGMVARRISTRRR